MTKSYYTSLCRAWLDHEVLEKQSEKEKLAETLMEKRNTKEFLCEWVIDRLSQSEDNSNTRFQLLEHFADIDVLKISECLYEEFVT